MRFRGSRFISASLLAVPVLLGVAGPVAAESIRFEATFRESLGRGSAPTNVGHVLGARVTEQFTFTGATPTGDPGCPTITTGTTVFTWPDGSTVTTSEQYLICFPGASAVAPGGDISYGNPETAHGTFLITGGTGVFAGITGSGTIEVRFAGDVLILHYSGTATAP